MCTRALNIPSLFVATVNYFTHKSHLQTSRSRRTVRERNTLGPVLNVKLFKISPAALLFLMKTATGSLHLQQTLDIAEYNSFDATISYVQDSAIEECYDIAEVYFKEREMTGRTTTQIT